MKQTHKQPRRPSKADVPSDQQRPSSDVASDAATGGDKESREPIPRPLPGGKQPHTTPGRKPSR